MSVTSKPQNRAKAIAAAALRIAGSTQKEAAKAVGRTEKTVRNWEKSSWWPDVVSEAIRNPIFEQLRSLSLDALIRSLEGGDGRIALTLLERMHPAEFGPRPLKVEAEHSGPDGGPIKLENEELAKMSAAQLGESYKDLIGK